MHRPTTRFLAASAAVAAVVGVSVGFFARAGGASVSVAASISVEPSGGVYPHDLFPAKAAGVAVIKVTNHQPGAIRVTHVGAGASDTAGSCPADSVRTDESGSLDGPPLAQVTDTGSPIEPPVTVIADGATGYYALVTHFHDLADADQNGCLSGLPIPITLDHLDYQRDE